MKPESHIFQIDKYSAKREAVHKCHSAFNCYNGPQSGYYYVPKVFVIPYSFYSAKPESC